MPQTGVATVSFGAGAQDAKVQVTGVTGLQSTSFVEAWPQVANNDDSPWVELLTAYAGNIVPDSGSGGSFWIYAKPDTGNAIGTYSICWVWN